MKTKVSLKIFSIFAILLMAMCMLNVNLVFADETEGVEEPAETPVEPTTEEEQAEEPDEEPITNPANVRAAEILAVIPNTINVAKKEIEFQDVNLSAEIQAILEQNSIDLTSEGFTFAIGLDDSDIRLANFELYSDRELRGEKDITIAYTNSSDYNTTDKEAVETIAAGFGSAWQSFDVDKTEVTENLLDGKVYQCESFLNSLIDDEDVKIKVSVRGGGGYASARGIFAKFYFFKNDVLYVSKGGSYTCYYEVIVPDDTEDTEAIYIKYALPKIKELYKKLGLNTDISMEYESGFYYGVYFNDNETDYVDDYIIVRKANDFMICDNITIAEDEDVSIFVDAIEEDDEVYTELADIAKENGYENIFNAYELRLTSGTIGEGGLTLTFSFGKQNDGTKAIILHKKASGDVEKFEETIENGKVKITVTELSPFLVALDAPYRPLDDEPGTGVVDYTAYAMVMAAISLVGLAVLKLKKQ